MSKTDTESEANKKEDVVDAKKMVGCGFDEQGYFRVVMHETHGSCNLLGFLEQAKDIVKAHFIQKAQQRTKSGIIMPSIHNATKGLKAH